MAGTEHHAVQPFLQHQPHAARQVSPPHDHNVDPLYRPSVSMAPPPRQPDSDTASLPEAEDVQLYEFKGLAARKASKVRVLARVLGKWIVTVALIVAVYAVLISYSVDRPVMSTTKKRQFNALITGLLITLGLSTASFLTGMCDDMRWWILSRRARSQHKVEHILHAHSTSRVIRLASRSKRSNIHVVVTLWVLLIIGAQVGIASIGLCYSVERTEDKALLVRGNVSIPDMSSIETTKVANGSNSQRAQEYTANSSSRGGARNVTLPVLGGSDQSTFFTDTMAPCGPTCGSVSVFEASSSSPWLYECNTTVGTPTNASLPEHALGDDLVWMVAMAVALQGYSTTAADEDLQVQGIVYPAATYWGTPMSGSSDALALLMSRFAIGVLGMAAQSNTALFVWGDAPTIGQKLNMEHWDMIHLIMVLTAGLQLVLGTAAALTAHRVVVPEGGPGGDVKTAWVYRNKYVGDGVYDLYMEEVLVPCKSSESKTGWGSKKGSRWTRLIKRNKENRASTDGSSSSRAGLRDG
ncbi:Protein pyrABCN [Verticillium dahliae VDG1]|nr:Protein pyrABCN [Verticillium dahliae VDG1]